MSIKNNIKRFACALGAVMLSAVCLAGGYGNFLPDSYTVPQNEDLCISSAFGISARAGDGEYTAALNNISAKSSGVSESTLMLFGAVPVKNVTTVAKQRPMVVPCGEPFGIKLLTDGVMVVDLTPVGGACPARECGILQGDIIVSINGENIRSNTDVSEIIKGSKGRACSIELIRDGKERTVSLEPVYSGGSYKAGMWVRDSSAGIGTLTFYDEATGAFGGLGHPVCDSDTREILPISEGAVGDIKITGLIPSEKGAPGQLLGEFTGDTLIGEISLNSREGLFGRLDARPNNREAIELAYRQEVKTGSVEILSSIDGGEAVGYSAMLEQVNIGSGAEHDMVIKITDERLITQAGGIVQGMSGSPIIQNGRLIGAVTHVFIDDPTRGYAIFADKMYEELESIM